MYTEFIGDEKRDIVEYTALGLLGSPWTMLTYTRAMDSVLCGAFGLWEVHGPVSTTLPPCCCCFVS